MLLRILQQHCPVQVVTDLLLDSGDSILCEAFTYFYMVDSVPPTRGYTAVPMEMDNQGICPQKLRQVSRMLLDDACAPCLPCKLALPLCL